MRHLPRGQPAGAGASADDAFGAGLGCGVDHDDLGAASALVWWLHHEA
jgi:hypothetical protein